MRPIELKFVVTGVLLLTSLVSGVWLSHSGKPLNGVIFTLHKLIALSAVIATVVTVNQLRAGAELGLIAIGALVITGLLFLSLFISGAWLSLGKPSPAAVLAVHKVIPLVAAFGTAGTLYLCASGL